MKMKYLFFCGLAFFSLNEILNAQEKLPYPKAQMNPAIDTYFGEEIRDNYRALEDDRSEETGKWVNAQNKLTTFV